MSQIKITFQSEGSTNAYIFANVVQAGVDGTDTFDWSWGIDLTNNGGYHEIDAGQVQHRDQDGSLALVSKIIDRIRGQK